MSNCSSDSERVLNEQKTGHSFAILLTELRCLDDKWLFFDEVVLVLQTLAQVLIFIYVGTMGFGRAIHMGRAEYLCKCLWDERIICSAGMKGYLFVSSLQPHEFLIFNFQTCMEEILQ